jgi:hypothetical protein
MLIVLFHIKNNSFTQQNDSVKLLTYVLKR